MARSKNDGRGRLGGRSKGTPNKVTNDMREWVEAILSKNKKQIERDFADVDPDSRLRFVEKLMAYVLPKKMAVTIAEQMSEEYKQLEALLAKCPQEAIDAIAAKVIQLQDYNRKEAAHENG